MSLLNNEEDGHGPVVDDFISWCVSSYLSINVSKTKDMLIDFRRSPHDTSQTVIQNKVVENVDEYKYLGTIIDSKSSFEGNTEAVYNKAQQRILFLRKMKSFNVSKTGDFVLPVFY